MNTIVDDCGYKILIVVMRMMMTMMMMMMMVGKSNDG